ncbi:MAG: type II secretion system GspH family protein [Gammaproteobacteria bacterium]|nr:type II secretion system GspH family protein [Gammaproteobacteria bacterium]MBU1480798.1 type II secretion system GspH family protein [Gammaproteobacteria bacterium]
MNTLRTTHSIMRRQRGAAFIVMLVIMIMGITAYLVSALSNTAVSNKRDETTVSALAQAKEALISYAVTYSDTHPGQGFGFLPCPDQNGTAGVNGEGSSETCGNQNVSAIGRLPWKTLGLMPMRNGNNECLWYAVAGTYKNNPMTYNMMNWDNNGLFQVLAASGVVLTGQTMDSNAAAVIFDPDLPLNIQGQNRAPDGLAPICGGNYTDSNFLDSDVAIGANNATPSTTANAVSQFFNTGATTNINDRIVFITKSDIFNAIKKRNDFGIFISNGLSSTATSACMTPLPPPQPVAINFNNAPPTESAGTSVGILDIGRVPKACLASPLDNWQDNFLYARCTSGLSCLTVNGTSCRGVIIFAGERNAFQTRLNNTQKNTWSNYLEDTPNANLTEFITGGNSFSGASAFTAATPSSDILACIL